MTANAMFDRRHKVPLLLWLIWAGTGMVFAGGFDHSHGEFDRVLKAHVTDGLVNYAALKANLAQLDRYLAQLSSVDKTDFERWPETKQLAFLLNTYNAFTLRLILDHYPVKSIKDIGGFFRGPWDQPVVKLFGQITTLEHVEHGLLRKHYNEPRIHFALVCAARGCPPLRPEAYVGARLTLQLDDQARLFLGEREKNRIEVSEGTVYLSPIFSWFDGDFEKKASSVLAFVQPYFPVQERKGLDLTPFQIKYTDYDWSLNERDGPRAK